MSRRQPVWAPRLQLPPAKIGKSKAGILWGRFWIPVRKSRAKRVTEPCKFQLQRMQTHTDLFSTYLTTVCHKSLYSNTHNPAP
jgi:hypothetical protein